MPTVSPPSDAKFDCAPSADHGNSLEAPFQWLCEGHHLGGEIACIVPGEKQYGLVQESKVDTERVR